MSNEKYMDRRAEQIAKLQAQLKEAVEVIEFYENKETVKMSGVYHYDCGEKARQFLEKHEELRDE